MANPDDIFVRKSRLRQSIREQLKKLDPRERQQRSVVICEKLGQLLAGKKSVALFAPRPTEPDLDILWDLGVAKDRLIAYPRCDGRHLLFFAVSSLQDLYPGKFGVREPKPMKVARDVDVIVVPGLAFTPTGNRLGQGAGFYDRFLQQSGVKTTKIGVCFDFQVIIDIPREEHDIDVDLLAYA